MFDNYRAILMFWSRRDGMIYSKANWHNCEGKRGVIYKTLLSFTECRESGGEMSRNPCSAYIRTRVQIVEGYE